MAVTCRVGYAPGARRANRQAKQGFDRLHLSPYNRAMREWSLSAGDAAILTLAAEARFGVPDYADDQVWEAQLAGGDPPAMALWTSYGRRAHSMRIFPFVTLDGRRQTDPARFAEAPRVRHVLPNYLALECRPFPMLALTSEAWVPESHVLAGRLALTNLSPDRLTVRLGLHVQLRPLEGGQQAAATNVRGVSVLAGRAGNLVPVVFLAGGAAIESAPVPGLGIGLTLEPGARRIVPWVHAGRPMLDESFDLARATAARTWDAELARLDLAEADLLQFETGDPGWDALLAFSQHAGLRSFLGPGRYLRHASFVDARQPDQGYSERGDGRDHGPPWSGQDIGRAGTVLGLVAHAAPDLAEGLLRNYLHAQAPDGTVDSRPGLAGQRSGRLAHPRLADWVRAWCERREDWSLARETLPRLMEFFRAWFSPAHDRDRDGFPEWDSAAHAHFPESPTFSRWPLWSQGLDMRYAETVDLGCYLVREAEGLMALASALGRRDLMAELEARHRHLRLALHHSWSEATGSFHAVDGDTHRSTAGGVLATWRGMGRHPIDRSFDSPVRLIFRVACGEAGARSLRLTARGRSGDRPVTERMSAADVRWFDQHGTATGERTFTHLETIECEGIEAQTSVEVLAADYSRSELTHLLPLWAGVAHPRQAQILVDRLLTDTNRYARRYGLPVIPADDPAYSPDRRGGSGGVWLPWNALVLSGLVRYGYRPLAAHLFQRIMEGLLACVRQEKAFFEAYNADAPQGLGERQDVAGAAPVEALLEILGLQLATPRRVRIEGHHPFDRPMTVRWRGLTVRREISVTRITFPDGEQIELDGDEARWVEQLDASTDHPPAAASAGPASGPRP
jgi:hypothetical protein